MPKDFSPFFPGLPIPIDLFVGRAQLVDQIRQKIRLATSGRTTVGFLSGERGIGKSSLARYVRHLVELADGIVGVHVNLGGAKTPNDVIREFYDRLLKESVGKSFFGQLKTLFGKYVTQLGVANVVLKFDAPEADVEGLRRGLAYELIGLLEKLGPEKKGFLIIFDDINGLAESAEFANWFKSFIDNTAVSGLKVPACFLFVGMDERRQSLIAQQPSLDRVLDPIFLRPWNATETAEFFKNALDSANTAITDTALHGLVAYSGGLPLLAHELGHAAFLVDEDGTIDDADAKRGVLMAAEVIGRRYLQPNVLESLQSKRYRSILRKIANHEKFDIRFTRQQVLAWLQPDEAASFDKFLARMRELGVIRKVHDQGRGVYTFTNLLHYLYFRIEADRAAKHRPDSSQD